MSFFDVHLPEMHGSDELDDSEVEALLAGNHGDESPLATFVEQLRTSTAGPSPEVGRELAAVFAVGLTSTEKGDLPATAASNAYGPESQAAGLPKWRRRRMVTTFLGTLVGKLAVGGVAAAAASTGILGAAGALPDPLQSAVSDVVAVVGVDLPHPDDDAEGTDDTEHQNLDSQDDSNGATTPVSSGDDGGSSVKPAEDESDDAEENDDADDADDADETDEAGDAHDDEADDHGEADDSSDEQDDRDDGSPDGTDDSDDDPDEGDEDAGDDAGMTTSTSADSHDDGDGDGDNVRTEHSEDDESSGQDVEGTDTED